MNKSKKLNEFKIEKSADKQNQQQQKRQQT